MGDDVVAVEDEEDEDDDDNDDDDENNEETANDNGNGNGNTTRGLIFTLTNRSTRAINATLRKNRKNPG